MGNVYGKASWAATVYGLIDFQWIVDSINDIDESISIIDESINAIDESITSIDQLSFLSFRLLDKANRTGFCKSLVPTGACCFSRVVFLCLSLYLYVCLRASLYVCMFLYMHNYIMDCICIHVYAIYACESMCLAIYVRRCTYAQ